MKIGNAINKINNETKYFLSVMIMAIIYILYVAIILISRYVKQHPVEFPKLNYPYTMLDKLYNLKSIKLSVSKAEGIGMDVLKDTHQQTLRGTILHLPFGQVIVPLTDWLQTTFNKFIERTHDTKTAN